MKNLLNLLITTGVMTVSISGCQKMDDPMFIELSTEFVQGEDGFNYVLTKSGFLTPFDVPVKQLKAKYGNETEIADWEDLKANFEDDFSLFLQNIGLTDIEKHEAIFITKDGKYNHLINRYFMLIGGSNQENSDWISIDKIENSKLIVAQRSYTGRVLLKLPAAP